jgi:hypothetical protein
MVIRPVVKAATASAISFVAVMVCDTPVMSVTASAETIPASAAFPNPTLRAPRTVTSAS